MKKIFSYLIMATLVVGFTACEDELEITPFDSIDATKAFQNITDIQNGANGVYGSMSIINVLSFNSLIADEVRRADTNTGQGMQLFDHNIIAGDGTVTGAWNNWYLTIDRANRVLAAIDDLFDGFDAADQATATQIRAEMLAIRAFIHFELYRSFVDLDDASGLAIPYMTVSEISEPARPTRDEFHTSLLADITAAEGVLTAAGAGSDRFRMNLTALQLLRARVALYLKDYDTAITYATNVLNAVPITTDSLTYDQIWSDQADGEVLFKLQRLTVADGTIGIYERSTNQDVFFHPGDDLLNQFDTATDIRYASWIDDSTTNANAPGVYVGKYNKIAGSKNLATHKMLRSSEALLIRSEANFLKASPDVAAATADIEALRLARIVGYTVTGGNLTIADLKAEKRKEFAFEGHRYYDLKRWGDPIVRTAIDTNQNIFSSGFAADDYRFVLPIPQSEVQANGNMVQNPGYN